MSSWYFSRLRSLASSTWSSQGTVGSKKRSCFEEADVSTTSGLKEVGVTRSGNLSGLPKSTRSSQSEADVRRLTDGVGCERGFPPALAKGIDFRLLACLLLAPALEMVSATTFSTWLCCQR